MKLKLRRSAERIAFAIEERELLAWSAVGLGVLGLVVTPAAGFGFWQGASLLLLGVALGAIGLVWSFRRKYPVHCMSCKKTYLLEGERGAKATVKETTRFRALTTADSFVFSILYTDGKITYGHIRFRSLGRKGRDPQKFIKLDEQHFVEAPAGARARSLRVVFPSPVKRKEHFEIQWTRTVMDSFEDESEAVSKRVLYPIENLSFHLKFKGCPVDNLHGMKLETDVPKETYTLDEESDGEPGLAEVKWLLAGSAKPGEKYSVNWRWN